MIDLYAKGWVDMHAEAYELLGFLLEKVSQLKESEQSLRRAVIAAEAGGDDEAAARASARLVRNAMFQAHFDEGRLWADHGFAVLERMGGRRPGRRRSC